MSVGLVEFLEGFHKRSRVHVAIGDGVITIPPAIALSVDRATSSGLFECSDISGSAIVSIGGWFLLIEATALQEVGATCDQYGA